MPLTTQGIFYANENSLMSIGDIFAALATSANGNIGILQVVNEVQTTPVTTNSTSTYVASGLSASITPRSLDSKILVLVNMPFIAINNANTAGAQFRLKRGVNVLAEARPEFIDIFLNDFLNSFISRATFNFSDIPESRTKVTYSVDGRVTSNAGFGQLTMNSSGSPSITLVEISA